MILLCGIPSEPPLAMVTRELEHLGAGHVVLDQREWSRSRLAAVVVHGASRGTLALPRDTVALESITAVYTRLMDDQRLPDVANEAPGSEVRHRCRRFHTTLCEWVETSPGTVLNRARAQMSNGSKPYQAQLIRDHGFSVPATLVTNDPTAARRFRDLHRRVVYKSISGVRSIVRELAAGDDQRLDLIRWCPVQFQEYVPGTDVRVHVVGRETFATRIVSDRVDYRYSGQDGGSTHLEEHRLSDDVAERCADLAADLDLPLAGIDLRITDEGRVVCFEVNPSPAFSYYESHTGQPIAAAVARLLLSGAHR